MKLASLLPFLMPKGPPRVRRVSRATLADLVAFGVLDIHPGGGGVRRNTPGGLGCLPINERELFNKGGQA